MIKNTVEIITFPNLKLTRVPATTLIRKRQTVAIGFSMLGSAGDRKDLRGQF